MRGDESVLEYRKRIERYLETQYRESIDTFMVKMPRSVEYTKEDKQSIEKFRETLMLNKYKHPSYNPNLDTVFARYLYQGLPEEAEKYILHNRLNTKSPERVPSVSDYIGTYDTHVRALLMKNSENAKKF
jgi:hypothetical protein